MWDERVTQPKRGERRNEGGTDRDRALELQRDVHTWLLTLEVYIKWPDLSLCG